MAKNEDTPAVTIGVVEPPQRKRQRKITLPVDVLDALKANLSPDAWMGNGVTYTGEDAEKDATTAARIYRRDLARHMNITERQIRTRVWGDEDNGFMFALRGRSSDGTASA
jgi:hypothetical protein